MKTSTRVYPIVSNFDWTRLPLGKLQLRDEYVEIIEDFANNGIHFKIVPSYIKNDKHELVGFSLQPSSYSPASNKGDDHNGTQD